jgi:membrane-bound transcription factor site-1 protease
MLLPAGTTLLCTIWLIFASNALFYIVQATTISGKVPITNSKNNNNNDGINGVTSTYIVSFNHYYPYDEHVNILASILGSSKVNKLNWQYIPRKNKATINFPSDFALIFLQNPKLQKKILLRDKRVKRVSLDQKYVSKENDYGLGTSSFGLSWSRMSGDEKNTNDGNDSNNNQHNQKYRYNKYGRPPFPFATDQWDGKGPPPPQQNPSIRRRRSLKFGSFFNKDDYKDYAGDITGAFNAAKIWEQGYTGDGIKVAVFDTGVKQNHPHFKKVKERSNWTDEPGYGDGVGHGTFVAGVIASFKDCLGFAPNAELYTYRVFTNDQVSFTSWFLDAFNYAIYKEMDVLNLSIGGPDYLDIPFYEKIREAIAHRIVVISAIGNDGPLWGTMNSPADQPSVLGVGGVDNYFDMASFASRGMTTWELPQGYGRVKPDIVSFSAGLRGSSTSGGCRRLGGTSVASPVIAGAVTLLASVIPKEKRHLLLNPGTMKQVIIESAYQIKNEKKHTASMFEQGAGLLDLQKGFEMIKNIKQPHPSLHPSTVDWTDCTYTWPYCTQPMYANAMPIILNLTILNGLGPSGRIIGKPTIQFKNDKEGKHLNVEFTHSSIIWPYHGFLGVHMTVPSESREFEGIVEGTISITVESPPPFGSPKGTKPLQGIATAVIKVKIIPTPPREKRILWDQFHNIRYPAGFFPRDNLNDHGEQLDWHGDHPHTNYHGMYDDLKKAGYFIEILGSDFTCFDAMQYGTLLMVDMEEEYYADEIEKLAKDINEKGLGLIVFGDWYNNDVLHSVKFFDENTREFWTPATGGANVPALNDLLKPFNIGFGDNVFAGDFTNAEGENRIRFLSGNSLKRFPAKGLVKSVKMSNQGNEMLGRGSKSENVIVFGLIDTNDIVSTTGEKKSNGKGGRIAVYGDSNCIDSNNAQGRDCNWLLKHFIKYTSEKILDENLKNMVMELKNDLDDKVSGKEPKRRPDCVRQFRKHSKVLSMKNTENEVMIHEKRKCNKKVIRL